MNWTEQKLNRLPKKHGFRLRGMEMTRLETFSDAAFAFATTLLVISVGSIPQSYQDLIYALKGVPAFAASFTLLTILWAAHRKWSRRYGLEDSISIFISLGLVFIMLVYVYPLRMISSALFSWISGGWLPSPFMVASQQELINLFIIYGLGFAAVMTIFAILYRHSLTVGDQLRLNAYERIKTREEVVSSIVAGSTGLASAAFAWLMPPNIGVFAGFVYMSLPISMPIIAIYHEKKAKTAEAK